MEDFATLRKKCRKRQIQLARALGVHPTTISQYERGRTRPSLERFAELVEALEVSPKRLLAALKESRRRATARSANVTDLQEARARRESRNEDRA